MKINWKLRLQNKTTLAALATLVITFVFQVLGILGVTTAISQDMVTNIVMTLINVLCIVGVITDPTTKGISDSERALSYDKPYEAEK